MHPNCDEFVRLMRGAGWGSSRAAQELGLHPTVVWKYTRGVTTPSLTVLRLLSGLTSQPLTLEGEAPLSFNSGPRILEMWEEKLIQTMRKLPLAARQRVISAVEQQIDAIVESASEIPRRRQVTTKIAAPTAAELGLMKLKEYGIDPGPVPASALNDAPPEPLPSAPADQRPRRVEKGATRPKKS